MNYASLIIDIEKSRAYSSDERNELQCYILKCLEKLNELYKGYLEREMTFSAGDEVQGLFLDLISAIRYFRLFELLLKPVQLRAGIGIGEWTIRIEGRMSTYQDGPVYHRARQAIKDVSQKQFHNISVNNGMPDDAQMFWVNYLINAAKELKAQQNDRQNEVQVMTELLFPFVDLDRDDELSSSNERKVECFDVEVVNELLEIKNEYEIRKNKGIEHKRYRKNDIIISPIDISEKIIDVEKLLVIKNGASIMAELMGCSRQNVDKIIRRGNVYKIREMDYMAFRYLKTLSED